MKKRNLFDIVELWWFYLSPEQREVIECILTIIICVAIFIAFGLLAYIIGKGGLTV